MLTGARAFGGDDVAETLANVINKEPAWDALPASVPAHVHQTLRLCLKKSIRERVPDIGAVRLALEGAFETVAPQTTASATASASRGRLPWMVATAAAVVGMIALALPAVRYLRQTPPPAPPETAEINTDKGCTKLSINNMRNGYVTGGILMDMARHKGVPYLEPGTPIFVEDLEAWEKKAGIKVGPGDALLVRTGRWARRAKLGPWTIGRNEAGLHASTAQWLKDRGVALIGSDSALGIVPSLFEGINLPIHTLVITALGLNILDNQDLEALGDLAAK